VGEIEGPPLAPPAPIGPHHDLGAFASGHAALDDWLRGRALRAEGRTARTYVVCAGEVVVGYYALATASALRVAVPGPLRRNAPDPVPLIVIGRLAVDARFQGRGIGAGLLRDALRRALAVSGTVGARAVVVHAIDAAAASFYRRYGFLPMPDSPQTLFLPIETIASAL